MNSSNESFYAIPRAIAADKNLSCAARLIAAHIYTFQRTGQECFASNKYLGAAFGMPAGSVANRISELRKAGWLEESGSGKNRKLILRTFTDRLKQPSPIREGQPSPIREHKRVVVREKLKREEESSRNLHQEVNVPLPFSSPSRDEGNRSEESTRTKYSEVAERARAKLRQTNQAASENETAWTVQEETQRFRVVAG